MCINDDIKEQYLADDAKVNEFKKLIERFMLRMYFRKRDGTEFPARDRECTSHLEGSAMHTARLRMTPDPGMSS